MPIGLPGIVGGLLRELTKAQRGFLFGPGGPLSGNAKFHELRAKMMTAITRYNRATASGDPAAIAKAEAQLMARVEAYLGYVQRVEQALTPAGLTIAEKVAGITMLASTAAAADVLTAIRTGRQSYLGAVLSRLLTALEAETGLRPSLTLPSYGGTERPPGPTYYRVWSPETRSYYWTTKKPPARKRKPKRT